MTFPDHLHVGRRRLKLLREGYTGVYSPDAECACELSDFAPCGNEWDVIKDCKPGYRHDSTGGDWDFFVSSSKEPPSQTEPDDVATLPLADET